MGLSGLRSPSRQRHKRSDKYQESRVIPAEMDKNYPVGRRESHAYEKSATALSVGIPRHNASAFGGGRMSKQRTSQMRPPYNGSASAQGAVLSVAFKGTIESATRMTGTVGNPFCGGEDCNWTAMKK